MEDYSAYVGLDVHKEMIAVAVAYPGRSEPMSLGNIANTKKSVVRLIGRLCAHGEALGSCYEAGPCGYEVYRWVKEQNQDCVVVAPSKIPISPGTCQESCVPLNHSVSKRAMLRAARELLPTNSLRPKTYFTLFGLLYTTGLRCGRAFALNLNDVDLERNLLFVRRGKFGKSRWVPFSASTSAVLQRYREERLRVIPAVSESPFFVTPTGQRLYHTNVDLAFRQVLKRCGLRGGKGCPGPRLHHLRHSFACTRLLAWYREGKDVQALLPALATYLGHVKVTSTQVYLQATANLLERANQRFSPTFVKTS